MKAKAYTLLICTFTALGGFAEAAGTFERYSLDTGAYISSGASTLGGGGSFAGQDIEDLVGTLSFMGVSNHAGSWIDLLNPAGFHERYSLDTGLFAATGVSTLSGGGSFSGFTLQSLVGTPAYLGTSNFNQPFVNLINPSGQFERYSLETGTFQIAGATTLSGGGSFSGQTIASLNHGSHFIGVSNHNGSWLDLVDDSGFFERYSLDTGTYQVTGAKTLVGGIHDGRDIEEFIGTSSLLGSANNNGAFLMVLSTTPVPEPSTAFFGLIGFASVFFRRTRNARNG